MFNLAAAQTSSATFLEGTVSDDTGETLMGASVKVMRGISVVGRTITTIDGCIPFLPTRQIEAVAFNSIFNPVTEPWINFRGARESGEMVYYGNYYRFGSIPVQEIEQPLIDPGGLPADFGTPEEYEMSKNHFPNLVRGGSEKRDKH